MAAYTPEIISHLVSYANSRGVRIVPEFDTPGHTAAIGQAYPDLIADCYEWLTTHYGSELRWSMWDSVALDVTKDETKIFVEDVMKEMSGLFPDQYFHVINCIFVFVMICGRLVEMKSTKVAGLLFHRFNLTCKRMDMPLTIPPLILGSMTTHHCKGMSCLGCFSLFNIFLAHGLPLFKKSQNLFPRPLSFGKNHLL